VWSMLYPLGRELGWEQYAYHSSCQGEFQQVSNLPLLKPSPIPISFQPWVNVQQVQPIKTYQHSSSSSSTLM
jgi:hypothetical protein